MMVQQPSYESVFEQLRSVLEPYAEEMQARANGVGHYHVEAPAPHRSNREISFGAVRVKKSYVSYHLYPVQLYPELIEELDADLKARMHGKSCFNFKRINETQLDGIARLTQACFERLKAETLA